LRGKVIWISGSSSGIGEALAYVLAKSGAKLVLSSDQQLSTVKEKCICKSNQTLTTIKLMFICQKR